MKRTILLSVIAVILLVIFVLFGGTGDGALIFLVLLLLVFLSKFFFKKEHGKIEENVPSYQSLAAVIQQYGEPDDTIVLDASRANELSSLILFYHEKDLALIDSHEVKISELTGVAPKNLASPYTVDEWAVVINTKNRQYSTFRLRVGYDGGLASEIANRIYENMKRG